ncbi:OLC1v1008194C1 [Oldenlandia corymbosa var. corymbosa]|uniref:OLC1v1008194C1 n=1 Tax=Oldenlandia corymbosa var. corymbosa TaxID=529605 RepID=A0AAV1DLD4_OLDCO|nr:OLC1v1008194C1 [Oldenlandia corymbosa var. corymbosa]
MARVYDSAATACRVFRRFRNMRQHGSKEQVVTSHLVDRMTKLRPRAIPNSSVADNTVQFVVHRDLFGEFKDIQSFHSNSWDDMEKDIQEPLAEQIFEKTSKGVVVFACVWG